MGNAKTDLESLIQFELKDIPSTIEIMNRKYVISSAILYTPPALENGIGHYVCAVRFNNNWEVYDDYRNETFTIENSENVIIHALHYTEL